MKNEERYARGKQTFKKVHGSVISLPDSLAPDSFTGQVVRNIYNDVWGRTKNLTQKERRLVVLGALAVTNLPMPLEVHIKSALELGELSAADLEEVAYMLSIYAGMPRTSLFMEVMYKSVVEMGAKKKPKAKKK